MVSPDLFICLYTSGDQKQNSICSRCLIQVGKKQLPYIQPRYLPHSLVRDSRDAGSDNKPRAPGRAKLLHRGQDLSPCQGSWDQAPNHRDSKAAASALDEHVHGLMRLTKAPSCRRGHKQNGRRTGPSRPESPRACRGGGGACRLPTHTSLSQGSRSLLPGLGNMPVLGEKSKYMAYFQQPYCFSL